jgi:hypothetical protein
MNDWSIKHLGADIPTAIVLVGIGLCVLPSYAVLVALEVFTGERWIRWD